MIVLRLCFNGRSLRWKCVLGIAVLCLAQTADTALASELVLAGQPVRLVDLEFRTTTGFLGQISDQAVEVLGEETRQLPWNNVLSLTFTDRKPAGHASGSSMVYLANGDRLLVRPIEMDDERIVGQWSRFPEIPAITVPLETILYIILDVPSDQDTRDRVVRELTNMHTDEDLLILKNGDRFGGELLGMEADRFRIDTALGPTQVSQDNVRAVVFNAELASFPKQSGRQMRVSLIDGSRVTAQSKTWAPEQLICVTPFGPQLTLDIPKIASLRFLGDGIGELSDLEPIKYEFTPYLSERWLLHTDRSVLGNPLCLRDVEYAKGLGLHSKARVVYQLDGQYRRFHAIVGIDDETAGSGDVIFRVELDDKVVWDSGFVSGTHSARSTGPIDVSGVRTLGLVVDFGTGGDVQDHADWCDPVLIK
jgi:hypothetical protein